MDRPFLSIIIVNSDGLEDTLNCLESIYRHPPPYAFEILLVDNCSKEDPLPAIALRFPETVLLKAEEKQGFSRNYNIGLKKAQGKFVLILNNDTLVQPAALKRMTSYLISQPDFGLAGPLLLNSEGKMDTTCARSLPTPWDFILEQLIFDLSMPLGRLKQMLHRIRLNRRYSGPVACISGACMLTSREAMERVGLLEEAYPLYFEDIEWCHRFQRAGYKVGFVREARITHLGDRTISKVRLQARKAEYRSAMLYFSAYYPFPRWQRRLLHRSVAFGYALRAWAFIISEWLTGKKQHAETYRQLRKWIREQPLPGEGAA